MKKLQVLILVNVLISVNVLHLNAQAFLSPQTGEEVSFRQMQRDFNEWKQANDLSEKKYWKYFKRFEAEMQLHTNAQGELEGTADYVQALIEHARERMNAQNARLNTGAWFPVGPNIVPDNLTGYMENGIGRINCITFHPTDANTYFVGVAQGGLWKTTNNGNSYTPLTDNLPITRISDIAINPNNPDEMYISVCDFEYIGIGLFLNGRKRHTHYGIGVYKTMDGGLSWNPTGLSFQLTDGDASLIRKIVIDPANPNAVVACGVSGMYKSGNAGTSWTQVMDSLFWDMIQDPVTPTTLYAATGWVRNANTGSAGIYKSTDFGTTWTLLTTGIPTRGTVQRIKLAQSRSNTARIYALAVDTVSGLHGIYRTNNGGTNWNMQFDTLNLLGYDEGFSTGGQGNYDLGFVVHPTNPNKIYVGGVNLWASEDGANSFDPAGHWTTSYGPSIHADVHDIQWQPLTGQYYLACDGGLYRTGNIIPISWNDVNNGNPWPTIWTNVSDGMNVTSFYRLSSSKSTTGELLAGAQDNASFYFDGTDWYTAIGGDGMDNCMDTAQPGTFIGSSQYGYFSKSVDGGFSSFGISPNIQGENAEWTTPLIADYSNFQTYYIGFQNVVKSSDGGDNWTSISSFPPPPNFYGNELSAIAVSKSNPDVLYAGRRVRYEYANPGAVFVTTNGGASWNDVTAGLPDSLYYTSIEIHPNTSNIAYISMAGFSAGNKIFKTINNGNNWTNITYNLPNIPVNCIKQIPNTNDLMIGTDLGVYVLQNGSTTWVNQSMGLPNVIVSDIEFNPSMNKIYISTFGRGIWATDLDVFTGMGEYNASLPAFQLHPSINNGTFSIINSSNAPAHVEIYNVKGKIVQSQSLHSNTEEFQLTLASGIYFAKIRGKNILEVKKFIVK
jgi:photosystem II stability/assembly factor-like uncharacterized protein